MLNWKEIFYAVFNKYPSWIKGIILGNAIKIHWGRSENNFGDCLAPYILRHYGYTPVYSQQQDSDIVLVGSILQWIPKSYKGIIFGTGGDNELYNFPNAKIIGVRGKLTLRNIRTEKIGNIILGDPGLIVNKVFPKPVKKEFYLGIIPHFVDEDHEKIISLKKKYGENVLFINVLRDAKKVIEDIKKCEYIASSSLHGLITADAFDIPNIRFVIRETMPTYFYDYKFDDYYSSLNTKIDEIELSGNESVEDFILKCKSHSKEVEKLQIGLDNLFKNLKPILR
jgi:pyruvyltransferase